MPLPTTQVKKLVGPLNNLNLKRKLQEAYQERNLKINAPSLKIAKDPKINQVVLII
jgi:hypothetical protein